MYEAKPTVKAGRRICHAITQTNCSRDRNSGSESILTTPFPPTSVRLQTFGSFPVRSLHIRRRLGYCSARGTAHLVYQPGR